jgi:aminopeptidase
MHIALGQSYANTFAGAAPDFDEATRERLGFNTSTLHWDMVATTPRRVTAHLHGGKRTTIYEDGMFRIL